jgi:hypothetical protein
MATSKKVESKPQTSKTVAAEPAASAKPVPDTVVASQDSSLPADQRHYYVEVAAYYIAERRGFHGGSELEDWAAAAEEVDRLLREGVLNP